MSPEERDVFLSTAHTAVLSSVDPHSRIHAVPVWFRYVDGAFRIITERGSAKHRNVVRTGRASLCVDERAGKMRYVTAEGPVEAVDEVTFDERLALHTRYRGEDAARVIVEQGGHERMVLLILRAEGWLGVD